jgi:hypothetical protein
VGGKNPTTASWPPHRRQPIVSSYKIMKTKEQNFSERLRRIFRRPLRRHDPMLVLNMSFFNYTDGWSRVFSKNVYGRFNA